MSNKIPLVAAVLTALAIPSLAFAQDVPWRVVLGTNASVTVPGLPAGSRSFSDEELGHVGAGYIGARLTSPSDAIGYWALKQGTWTQFTKTGVAGSTLGPGRTGAEAGHVFASVLSGGNSIGTDGQRAFIASAGVSNDPNTTTWGVWRWNTTNNVELVRGLVEGANGPNLGFLGSGWVYQNTSSTFQNTASMNNGQVLINAYVTSPSGQSRQYLAKSVPGQPVTPCALRNATDSSLAPGLAAGDYFDTTWSFNDLSLSTQGDVYGELSTNQGRVGIWKLCAGAPHALAVNNETGVRGPDIGISTATFVSFSPANPGIGNNFNFFASFRSASGETSRLGLFWNDGTTNRPLAINDAANFYGPHWNDATWSSFTTSSLTTAGEWSAFQGVARASDGGTPSGLWRVHTGGSPEHVALIGLVQYGPEPNRTWDAFYGNAVLANGDIILEARTQPGSEYAVWLLKKDGTKQRILKVGQTVSVPTANGVMQSTVTSYSLPSGAAAYGRGGDSWIGIDGSLLIRAGLNTYGTSLITALPSNPVDKIYANGFDG